MHRHTRIARWMFNTVHILKCPHVPTWAPQMNAGLLETTVALFGGSGLSQAPGHIMQAHACMRSTPSTTSIGARKYYIRQRMYILASHWWELAGRRRPGVGKGTEATVTGRSGGPRMPLAPRTAQSQLKRHCGARRISDLPFFDNFECK